MKRELYKNTYFNEGQIPRWNCPTCSTGWLKIKEKLFVRDNAATRREINEDYFDRESISRVFTGALSCAKCGEIVVFSGCGGMDREPNNNCDFEWVNYYVPYFFYPALKIIDIPCGKSVSGDMAQAVAASFLVFWSNLDV